MIKKNLKYTKNLFSQNNTHNEYLSYLVLIMTTILTRILFMTKYLFEWDSVQLALGIRNFNILQHQPHPPGYFFYVHFGKYLNSIIGNANYSLITINIFFTIVAAILFYNISLKIFKDQKLSILSAIIFITNPFIWFHGEFVNIYIIDSLFALIYFYLSYLIIKEKKSSLYLFSLLFGIGIGFRQSLIIFFLPLYLFTAYHYLKREKHYFQNILSNLIILISTTLLWLIPTSYLTGGLNEFFEITKNQYFTSTISTTFFSLSKIAHALRQAGNTLKLFFYSGGILSIFIIYSFLKGKLKFHKKIKTIFWFWFLPSFLFYSFVHLGKAGYIMTITPLILILGITAIYKIKSIKHKYLIISIVIIFQCITFLFNMESLVNNKKLLINVSPYTINAINLKNNDYRIEQIIDTVQKYNPQKTILITEGDSPYIKQRTNFIKNARHLNYYLPEYPIYYLFNDRSGATKYYLYQNDDMRLLYQSYVPIDQEIENILLITDDYNYEIYDFQYVNHFIDETIFYKDISNEDAFEYINYNFAKQY
jgi:Dolichyl-phosphate-mannose-protein mannosyltransferase